MRNELLAQPEFSATDSSVSVVLPVLSGTSPEERAWVREVEARGQIEERDRVLLVHARRGEIVLKLAEDGAVTNSRVRAVTGLDRQDALSILDELVAKGLLVRKGQKRGTRYVRAPSS